jgi:hypothetical protein
MGLFEAYGLVKEHRIAAARLASYKPSQKAWWWLAFWMLAPLVPIVALAFLSFVAPPLIIISWLMVIAWYIGAMWASITLERAVQKALKQ